MSPHLQTVFITVAIMAFVVWRRARRLIGRQPIRRKQMITRVVIYVVLTCLLAASGLHNLRLLEGLLGGLLAGGALGLLGLRLSRFERGADGGDYYVPNPWLGAALAVLLIGRLVWRMLPLLSGSGEGAAGYTGPGAPPLGNSPLTLLLFGLLIGYYLTYYVGLLVHHRRFQREQGLSSAN